MSILIKNVLLDDKKTDILIEGNRIAKIAAGIETPQSADCEVINAEGMAALPTFVNMHTHIPMTLFRGYGDDLPLQEWLNTKIWPNEKNLDEEIIYWGTKLGCLEMIKTGTTCFSDMYFFLPQEAQAVKDMGIRGVLGFSLFDGCNPDNLPNVKKELEGFDKIMPLADDHVQFSMAPHAPYTVSGASYQYIKAYAKERNLLMHTHVAETQGEVDNTLRDFGLTPVQHLHKWNALDEKSTLAHCVYLSDDDIKILADTGATVTHNPTSNLKLGSGLNFRYPELVKAGVNVTLGTDGCSSSNNLDMREAVKMASFIQKGRTKEPTVMPTSEALAIATVNGAKVLGLNMGRVAEGCLADFVLVNLNTPAFTPNHNTLSNWIYAADSSVIDTLFCDGKILMRNHHVEGEEEIMAQAIKMAKKLIKV
ncbi:MAG: amidohydrolase [Bacteroidales bacterium]|nr:amidohydrolase [Bacteroidales bacterium]